MFRNMDFYGWRRYAVVALCAAAAVVAFLWYSASLVGDLAEQERARVQLWADATREITIGVPEGGDAETSRLNFLLGIVKANTNIPVMLADDSGHILDHRNFSLPEPLDSLNPLSLSAANEEYLHGKLNQLAMSDNVIHIAIAPGENNHIYYEESRLLRRLSVFPYVLVGVMIVFIAVAYFAVRASRRAEQDRLWVGLSKETAHQLGTPISSLMAWIELMRADGADSAMVDEMDKDVSRLSTVASRFSKIGSRPSLEPADICQVVDKAVDYMSKRISRRVVMTFVGNGAPMTVLMSEPLVEWVIENLVKNAVDAMDGSGHIEVRTEREGDSAAVYVTDSGRGMSRKTRNNVFRPGFTTKKRGWGLGLALARRIIEKYHGGSIRIVSSVPGQCTTFRFSIPLI